jgi:hypothetical protein
VCVRFRASSVEVLGVASALEGRSWVCLRLRWGVRQRLGLRLHTCLNASPALGLRFPFSTETGAQLKRLESARNATRPPSERTCLWLRVVAHLFMRRACMAGCMRGGAE